MNRLRRILDGGGLAFGAYTGTFHNTAIVEIIGLAGFDAAFVDMEHNLFDLASVAPMIVAAENVGITAVVRVPGLDVGLITRLLDLGVGAVYVPHVRSAAEARAAVEAVRLPPLGSRVAGPNSRAARYGARSTVDGDMNDARIVLSIMVEDLTAVDEIDEIVAVEGIDLLAIGPTDLSRDLGVSGQADHPLLRKVMARVFEAIHRTPGLRAALPVGHPAYPRTAKELRELGVGYANCTPHPETRLLSSLRAQLAALQTIDDERSGQA